MNFKRALPAALLLLGATACTEIKEPPAPPEPNAIWSGDLPHQGGGLQSPSPASPTPSVTESGTTTPSNSPSPTEPSPTATLTQTPTGLPPTPTGLPATDIPTPTAPILDPDRDGFTEADGDCDPNDGDIYPGALEIPLDGIDSDCDGIQDFITNFASTRLNEGGSFELARMYGPQAIIHTDDDILYYADAAHCRIRQVVDGIVTTLAGTGQCGYGGDGENASSALLDYPSALALDEAGNRLFFSDTDNHRVREIDLTTGIIRTFAGTGDIGWPVDQQPASQANMVNPWGLAWVPASHTLYLAEYGSLGGEYGHNLWRIQDNTGIGPIIYHVAGTGELDNAIEGPANQSPLNGPHHLDVDPFEENIYLALSLLDAALVEISNPRSPDAQLRLLVGGTSAGECLAPVPLNPREMRLCSPESVLLTEDDGVLMALRNNNSIIRYDFDSDRVEKIAGSQVTNETPGAEGEALDVYLHSPVALFPDDDGGFYLSDAGNFLLRHYFPGDNKTPAQIKNIGGARRFGHDDGPNNKASFYYPRGIEVSQDGETGEDVITVCDHDSGLIRQIKDGVVTTVVGVPYVNETTGDDGPVEDATLYKPQDVAVDDKGVMYIYTLGTIRRVKDGIITTIAGGGESKERWLIQPAEDIDFDGIYGIEVSNDGSQLFVAESDFIRVITDPGGFNPISQPFVGNENPDVEGIPSDPFGNAISAQYIDWHDGFLYYLHSSIQQKVMRSNGLVLEEMLTAQGVDEQGPYIDAFAVGKEGHYFISYNNNGVFHLSETDFFRVMGDGINKEYNTDEGIGDEVFYNGGFDNTLGVGQDGNLYIVDTFNHVIRMINW